MHTERVDVVIVGASLAGCSTAILLARQGLKVRVVDRKARRDHHKHLCTHLIQNSAVPSLERIGLLEPMLKAGAHRTGLQLWTRYGWFGLRADEASDARGPTWNLNLRREVLDPLVCDTAANTPGVTLQLGATLRGLIEANGVVQGIEVETGSRRQRIAAKLVIGADGRHSRTAEMAQIATRVFPNERGGWAAYYRNVKLTTGADTQFWLLEPEIVYTFPTDSGLTLLTTLVMKDQLPVWKRDIESHHRRLLESLHDGPDLSCAERVSDFVGVLDAPGYYRYPQRPGLALVGDAALTSDYVWGVGCAWAFRSADLLASTVAPALAGGADLNKALARYARLHRKTFYGEHLWNMSYSTRHKFDLMRRLIFSAAPHDRKLCRTMFDIHSGRVDAARGGLSALGRALWFHATHWARSPKPSASPRHSAAAEPISSAACQAAG